MFEIIVKMNDIEYSYGIFTNKKEAERVMRKLYESEDFDKEIEIWID